MDDLASWARDADFPFLFGSDSGSGVGMLYGAWQPLTGGGTTDNRTLFVIDADGVIRYVAAPFDQNDPRAYDQLAEVIERVTKATPG